MHYLRPRRLFSVALIATVVLVALPSQAAGRRRAAAHPTAANKLTAAKISGTVVDDVTGQPIVLLRVRIGDRSDVTDNAGKFEVRNVTSFQGTIVVEASRSGYTPKTVNLTTGGEQVLNLRLQPLPTVRVRKSDNTTLDLDSDSIEFGYPVVFSGYLSNSFDEFCKPNGTAITVSREDIRKINGPATKTQQAACCGTHEVEKINVELKTGEVTDLYFVDTCNGIPSIDLIGRNHSTGRLEYTPFTAITEVVFP
jgi:hypothetical protein